MFTAIQLTSLLTRPLLRKDVGDTPSRRSFEDDVIDIARPSVASRSAREQAGEDVFSSSPNTANQAGAIRKVGKGMNKTTTINSKSSLIAIHGSHSRRRGTYGTMVSSFSTTQAFLFLPRSILIDTLFPPTPPLLLLPPHSRQVE